MTPLSSRRYIMKHGILVSENQVLLMEPLFVFKKVYEKRVGSNYVPHFKDAIASLAIPKGALVNLNSKNSVKCRASKALCKSIVHLRTKVELKEARSNHNVSFVYRPLSDENGRKVSDKEFLKYAHNWDLPDTDRLFHYARVECEPNPGSRIPLPFHIYRQIILPTTKFSRSSDECASGIHFFVHSSDAVNY